MNVCMCVCAWQASPRFVPNPNILQYPCMASWLWIERKIAKDY